jgi:hypothetical protein
MVVLRTVYTPTVFFTKMNDKNKNYQLIELKIAETYYFYTKLVQDETKALYKKYYFSAFISAARSITFCIRYVFSDIKGFNEWYEKLISKFKIKNNILNRFNNMRVDSVHKGVNPLKFNIEFLYFENNSNIMYIFENDNVTSLSDALCQCKEYFLVLLFISFEVYAKLGMQLNSDEYDQHKDWIEIGRELNRNVFDYMGIPHRWRNDSYGYTDAKMHLLNETVPRSIIDNIIENLLEMPGS